MEYCFFFSGKLFLENCFCNLGIGKPFSENCFWTTVLLKKQFFMESSAWKTVFGKPFVGLVGTPYFVSDEKKPSLTARHHPSERLCDACKDHVIWKRQSLQVVFRFHRLCRTAEFNQFRSNQLSTRSQHFPLLLHYRGFVIPSGGCKNFRHDADAHFRCPSDFGLINYFFLSPPVEIMWLSSKSSEDANWLNQDMASSLFATIPFTVTTVCMDLLLLLPLAIATTVAQAVRRCPPHSSCYCSAMMRGVMHLPFHLQN